MNSLRIAYVGPFGFPDGGAAARRILGNIAVFQSLGSDVMVVDGGQVEDERIYGRIKVVSVGERPSPQDSVMRKIIRYARIGKRTIDYFKGKAKPDVIVLYSGYSPYLIRLIPFCRKHNIKLIFDCVEWYLPKRRIEYLYRPYYWNIEIALRLLVPMCDGVICISNYFLNYYSNKNVKVIRVPPIYTSL